VIQKNTSEDGTEPDGKIQVERFETGPASSQPGL
jgi:hypothetical protein